jgi:hypothetical protein
MDTRLILVPLVVFLMASLLMALPGTRSRGCLAYLVRLVGFMVGALSPLIILWQLSSGGGSPLRWQFPGAILTYFVIIVCIVLGGCAVTLAAAGWQILLRRGRGDFEEKIDLSWFGLPDFSSPMTSNLSLESCFGIVAFVLLGGLFWLGLILGSAIKDSLVRRLKGPGSRAIQTLLSFTFGLVLFGLGIGGLLFVTRDSTASSQAHTPPNVFIEVPAPGSPESTEYIPGQVPYRLDDVWQSVSKGMSPNWGPEYTPLFPTEWPPQPRTLWIRYAYATGAHAKAPNTDVLDVIIVGPPWALAEFSAGSDPKARVVLLGNKIEEIGSYDYVPPNADDAASLSNEEAVFNYCLGLTAAPDEGSTEVAQMRAFYNAWLRYNGTIGDLIGPNHRAFLSWVAAKP